MSLSKKYLFCILILSFFMLGITLPTEEKAINIEIIGGYTDGANKGIILDKGFIHGITEGTTGKILTTIAGGVEVTMCEFRITKVFGESSSAVIINIEHGKVPESGEWKAKLSDLKTKITADPLTEEFQTLDSNLWHKAGWTLGDTAFPGSGDNEYVKVENGELILKLTQNINKVNWSDKSNPNYIGGHVFTDPKFSYGSYRAEILAPKEGGIIAGFFLYDKNKFNKDMIEKADEIDVEILSSSASFECSKLKPDILFSTWNNWHEGLSYGISKNHQVKYLRNQAFNPASEYHTYGFDWFPNMVEYYIDGKKVMTITDAVPQPPLSIMANIWANKEWKETCYPPKGDAEFRIRKITYKPYVVDAVVRDDNEAIKLFETEKAYVFVITSENVPKELISKLGDQASKKIISHLASKGLEEVLKKAIPDLAAKIAAKKALEASTTALVSKIGGMIGGVILSVIMDAKSVGISTKVDLFVLANGDITNKVKAGDRFLTYIILKPGDCYNTGVSFAFKGSDGYLKELNLLSFEELDSIHQKAKFSLNDVLFIIPKKTISLPKGVYSLSTKAWCNTEGIKTIRFIVEGADSPKTDLSSILTDKGSSLNLNLTKGPAGTSHVVLLMDVSGSMNDDAKLYKAKKTAIEYIRNAGPLDRIALVTFNTRASLLCNFKAKREEIIASINSLKADGGTAINDALLETMNFLAGSTESRRIIILVTDGLDQNSKTSIKDLHFKTLKLGVEINTVAVGSDADHDFLRSISKGSGASPLNNKNQNRKGNVLENLIK